MIGRLTGKVIQEEGDGTLVLDVHGVGYEAVAPIGTVGRLRISEEDSVTLFVHTHVREDALQLFGFATLEDRFTFRTLLGIPNVGPKLAIALLSSLPASELARVVDRKEIARLTVIPGVGKKTAERLLLELRDKLIGLPAASSTPAALSRNQAATSPETSAAPGHRELLSGALTRMGYRPVEADRAIEQLTDKLETLPLGDLIREALLLLAR